MSLPDPADRLRSRVDAWSRTTSAVRGDPIALTARRDGRRIRYGAPSSEVTAMNANPQLGPLESKIMEVLWVTADAATPAQVLEALHEDLAYTTVMTILTRLWKKGVVTRSREGRAYAYAPKVSKPEFVAERMSGELHGAADHAAVLNRFVDKLHRADVEALRDLLADLDEPR